MPLNFEDAPVKDEFKSVSEFLGTYPVLKESSEAFCKKSLHEFGTSEVLYVAQREYGTVTPDDESVTIIGSEDATTCHIIVLHCRDSGAISLGHFDGTSTEQGIKSMMESLSQVSPNATNCRIELHMVGGFLDDANTSAGLSLHILDCFRKLPQDVHLVTFCVTDLNDVYENGQHKPKLYGIGFNVREGKIFPASFADKGPEEVLRHARIFGGHEEMLEVYSSSHRQLRIGPFSYHVTRTQGIRDLLRRPDDFILQVLSTSPHCEPASFAATTRAALQNLLDHPDPMKSEFPTGKPHIYKREHGGAWVQVS